MPVTAPKFDGTKYTVANSPGVAYYLTGFATYWTDGNDVLICEDEDCDHSSDMCWLCDEPEECEYPDRVTAIMVGDDRKHVVDISDLTEIGAGDYCLGCGQTGCTAERLDV